MKKEIFLTVSSLLLFLTIYGQGIGEVSRSKTSNLDSLIISLNEQVDSNQIRNYMQGLEDFGSRYMKNSNRYEIALWIKQQFNDIGISQTAIDDFEVTMLGGSDTTLTQYNVSAILPGISDSLVVVGAHYDSFNRDDINPVDSAPGADDNASGTAGVLELARVFYSSQTQPYYTMVFVAFGAEERKMSSINNGAQEFADKLIAEGRYVHLMLNLDMIANDDTGEMGLGVHRAYNGAENHNWIVGMADTLAKQYTDLKIYYDSPPAIEKTDDLPFADAGFKTIYFFERDFSPNYHSNNDLVENCEIGYCAEVIKLGVASLAHAAHRPDPVKNLRVLNEPDGSGLSLLFNQGDTKGIEYKIEYGPVTGQSEKQLMVQDTLIILNDLEEDQEYLFKVYSVNSRGYHSVKRSVVAKLLNAPMDEGILIVNASDTNLSQISNDSLDRYYEYLTDRFVVTTMQIDTASDITPELLSSYSTVFFHSEERMTSFRVTSELRNCFENYRYWGGKMFVVLYEPAKVFGFDYENNGKLSNESFMRKQVGIDSVYNQVGKILNYVWGSPEYPDIRLDEDKIPYGKLFLIEGYKLNEGGEEVFKYGSDYDSTSSLGLYHGKTVASINSGEEKNVFLMSVPLYYLETEACKEMTHDILRNKFGEFYVNIPEINNNLGSGIRVYPNPAKNILTIDWHKVTNSKIRLTIFDLKGLEVLIDEKTAYGVKKSDFNISHLKPGVYLYRLLVEDEIISGKFTKK